jgi:hypothetical protein
MSRCCTGVSFGLGPPVRPHAGTALGRACQDHFSFHLGHTAHDGQHHAALCSARVGPLLSDAAERGPGLVDALDDAEQVEDRAGQAVDAGDDHHIPRLYLA